MNGDLPAQEQAKRPDAETDVASKEGGDGLARARSRLAEMASTGEKVVRLDPLAKARKDPNSLRLAINAMCWTCCGAGSDGLEFTKQTIRDCRVTRCPLHLKRPYQANEPEAA